MSKDFLSRLFTGMPDASAFPLAFPRMQLTPGDLAAIKARRIVGAAVRLGQVCALAYGVVYTAQRGGVSGLIVGIILAWLVGLAMPHLPASVCDKITRYLADEAGPE